MKIFLSAIDSATLDAIERRGVEMKWNLLSFYYIKKNMQVFHRYLQKSDLILIDSGAHSFQKGTKVDWIEYTKEYAEFIKRYDNPKIIGYFEMDVDNIIGYEKVLHLRRILESVSSKIIPVWHKNRGIADFKRMCRDYANKIVAITGFSNEDIKDAQYPMFLKEAKKCGCRVHCLGMTRTRVLDKVPFDYTDSASWKLQVVYGRVLGGQRLKRKISTEERKRAWAYSYSQAVRMQEYYYNKWKKYCKD